ncbi:hypothetical protein ACU4GI_47155 (plasmid) [Cupriavidus basilensis]
MKLRLKRLIDEIWLGLTAPTSKQKESIARYAHSLSAVCTVAAVTFAFGAAGATGYPVLKTTVLALWGVLLFLAGLLISNGE